MLHADVPSEQRWAEAVHGSGGGSAAARGARIARGLRYRRERSAVRSLCARRGAALARGGGDGARALCPDPRGSSEFTHNAALAFVAHSVSPIASPCACAVVD